MAEPTRWLVVVDSGCGAVQHFEQFANDLAELFSYVPRDVGCHVHREMGVKRINIVATGLTPEGAAFNEWLTGVPDMARGLAPGDEGG